MSAPSEFAARASSLPMQSQKVRRREILTVLTAITLVYVFGIAILPHHSYASHLWVDAGWTLGSAAPAVKCAQSALRRRRGPRSWFFWCLSAGCASWTIGMLFWDYEELVRGVYTPFPGPGEAFFLLALPCFTAAMWALGLDRPSAPLSLKQFGDFGTALCTVVAVCLMTYGAAAEGTQHEPLFVSTAVTYAIASSTAFVFGLLSVWSRKWSQHDLRVVLFVLAGLVTLAGVNTWYGYMLLRGTYEAGLLPDALWLMSFLLVLAAAYEDDLAPQRTGPGELRGLSFVDSVIPAAVMLAIVLAAFGVGATSRSPVTASVLGWCAALAIALALRGIAMQRIEAELRARVRMHQRQFVEAQKMEAVGTLASGLAHDFNNVLTGVLSGVELLRLSSKLTPAQTEYVDLVEQSSERASTLTKRLLSLSRRRKASIEPVRPAEIVRLVATLLRGALPDSIEIRADEGDHELVIDADRVELEQALINLGINASRAMPSGGRLDLVARVEPAASKTSATLVFEVSDTGAGIPEELRERIFDPFFTTRPSGEGTGLGLPMVRAAAEGHGGTVTVESVVNKGSKFGMRIPLVRASTPPRDEPARPDRIPTGSERILVVDDRAGSLLAARMVLEYAGYSVACAYTATEALEWLRSDPSIALVLTDSVMPGMSGVELIRAIDEEKFPVGVVLMTAFSRPAFEPPRLDALIEKPFRPSVLATIVREVLDRRAQRVASGESAHQ